MDDDQSGVDRVRQVMEGAIDVEQAEGVSAPHPDDDNAPSPDFDPMFDNGDAPPPPDPGEDGAPPPAARCVELPLNDFGNGRRVITHFGENLVYVARVGWFTWAGTHYEADPDGIAVRRLTHRMTELIGQEVWFMELTEAEAAVLEVAEKAKETVIEIGKIKRADRTDEQIEQLIAAERRIAEAKELKDRRDKSVGRRLTHAKNAGNTNAIKNMLTEASAILARPLEDLDRDPLVINTLGGVLRFRTEPGEDDGGMNPPSPRAVVDRLDHDRSQLLTKIMPVEYDPGAECPQFEAFMERIQPQAEMRRFLQRWLGLSMTGLTGEQKFAFFYGDGANGKGVLNELMARLLDGYAATAKIESITGRSRRGGGDATPDLVPLIGARFVRTSEPNEGERLQEGLIKELTGGEPILVRPLNENFVLVYPIFKLTISGNHKPEIHGGDDGIWRRVLLIPFEVQIPEAERDHELGDKLWEERAGVLNWLIAGLLDYLEHGLQVPDTVLAATEEYREDSDPLATFLTACCTVTGKAENSIRSKDLSEAFAYWLEERGGGAWTPRTIFKRLSARAGKWKHPETRETYTKRKSSDPYYDGIALIEPFKTRFEEHQRSEALRRNPYGNGDASDD